MKILSVEDDPTASLVIESLLKSLGHEVVCAVDGAGALEIHRKTPVRLIVSDWQMAGGDGLALCRQVRTAPGDYVYFILLTQQEPTEENERLAMQAGVDDFLTKPVRARELRTRLHVAERILGYTQQVQLLEKSLPICGYCKKIRDDRDYWAGIEEYVTKRTGSNFSHGICPTCYEQHIIPQLAELGAVSPETPPKPAT